jgi:hypothetical protein
MRVFYLIFRTGSGSSGFFCGNPGEKKISPRPKKLQGGNKKIHAFAKQ